MARTRPSLRLLTSVSAVLFMISLFEYGIYLQSTLPQTTPREVVTTPRKGVTTPRKGVTTPRKGVTTPRKGVTEPPSSQSVRQHATEIPRRGPLTNCTLADIQTNSGVMVLSSTNYAFLDITLNLLASIRKTGVCVNTTIVAADELSYRYLMRASQGEPGLSVLRMQYGNNSEKLSLNSLKYKNLTNQRPGYLLSFIEKGYKVLYTDADTYWFKDPLPFFKRDFDVAMLNERILTPEKNVKFCDGFGFFKPTQQTKDFLKWWVVTLNRRPTYSDQAAMNIVLQGIKRKKMQLNILSLEMSSFPGGRWFFNPEWYKANGNQTVAMHSSFVINHDNKVKMYKKFNMWHYNATQIITD